MLPLSPSLRDVFPTLRRSLLALGLCVLAVPLPARAVQLVRRINVDGAPFVGTDFPGTWEADPGVCGPHVYENDTEIHNTVDDPLFTGEAYGNPMTCQIDDHGQLLPPGLYTVKLLFAEIYWGPGCPGGGSGTGSRVFNVALEGNVVDSAIDLFSEGGCAASTTDPTGHPVTRTYTVAITDGVLDVSLYAFADNGKISAIELIGPQCTADADCDDGNACTDDVCVAGLCQFTNNATPCSDGSACTSGDVCSGGTCQPGAPLDCDDGNACTADSCDAVQGCAHVPIPGCPAQVPAAPPWGYALLGALLIGVAAAASSSRRRSTS
jgi:hypothetical protein